MVKTDSWDRSGNFGTFGEFLRLVVRLQTSTYVSPASSRARNIGRRYCPMLNEELRTQSISIQVAKWFCES
ncbi:hypothetical protein TNCV_3473571 [Trichonephila clavipes]|nr:hypothetical protein TNCV_3473571 [Trichonephila clavipes]